MSPRAALTFPPDLEGRAFRASNGEFGWTRAEIPAVVNFLHKQAMGILGGELWWMREGSVDWFGAIPQRDGPPGVYVWTTEYKSGEPWVNFIERGVSEALAAVDRWPTPSDLPPDLPGRILYNLTWCTEAEFKKLIE